jgi:hypothetical protein
MMGLWALSTFVSIIDVGLLHPDMAVNTRKIIAPNAAVVLKNFFFKKSLPLSC